MTALAAARAQILAGFCDVALVIGADTTPKGFLAPNKGERGDDPDWLRFRLLGATNPTFFGLYARRRMELFGATREDFARVKVKNAKHGLGNEYARYKKEVSIEDVLTAPIVSEPLGLLDICATSDGAAALVVSSVEYAQRHGVAGPVRVRGISTVTPSYPQTTIELPNFATDSAAGTGATPEHGFKESIAVRAYEEAGLGPDDLDCAEVYDLSTAMELDWYEQIGLCKPGEAEQAAARRFHHPGRTHPGQRERRSRVLRRSRARPGDRAGVRADLAGPGARRGPPGRGRERRPVDQPGSVRTRLGCHREQLTAQRYRSPRGVGMAFKTEFVPGANDVRDLRFRPADPQLARTLTRAQVETFNRDGFVSPIPAFSADQIRRLKTYVDDLIEQVVSAPDRRNSYSITSYHLVCRVCTT